MTSLDPLISLRPKAEAGRSPSGDEAVDRAASGFEAMLDALDTRPAPRESASFGAKAGSEASPLPVDTRDETDREGAGSGLQDLMALTVTVPAAPPVPPEVTLAAVVQRAVARAGTTATAEAPTQVPRITLVGIETHFAPVRPAAAEVGAGAGSFANDTNSETFGLGSAVNGSSATAVGINPRAGSAQSAAATDTASAASVAMTADGPVIGGAVPGRTGGAPPAIGLQETTLAASNGPLSAASTQFAPSPTIAVPPRSTPSAEALAPVSPGMAPASSAMSPAATGGGPDPARLVRATGPVTQAGGDTESPVAVETEASIDRRAVDRSIGGAAVAGGRAAMPGTASPSGDASDRSPVTGTTPAGVLAAGASMSANGGAPNRASAGNGMPAGRSDAAREAGSTTPDAIGAAKRSDRAPAQATETGRQEPSLASDRAFGAGSGTEGVPASTGTATVATPTGAPALASPLRQIVDAVSAQFPTAAATSQPRTGLSTEAGPLRILTLQLHPAELGTVLVRMRLQDGRLEMNLRTGREETAERLRRDGGALAALLQEAGYAPQALTIEAGSSNSGNAAERGTAQNAPFGGQERHPGGAAPDQSADRRAARQGAEAASQTKEQDHDSASRARDRGDVYL